MERLAPLTRAWPRAAFAACAVWLVLYELRVLVAPELDAGPLTSRFAHDVVLLAASALILARALEAGRERLAWLLIGAGVLAWSLGEVYYTAVLWDAEVIAIPSPADIGYLLLPPLALAGILLLLRARARAVPRTLWVDGVIAALAVAARARARRQQQVADVGRRGDRDHLGVPQDGRVVDLAERPGGHPGADQQPGRPLPAGAPGLREDQARGGQQHRVVGEARRQRAGVEVRDEQHAQLVERQPQSARREDGA